MYVGKISEVSDEIFQAAQRLIPQLGVHKIPPAWDELNALIRSQASKLLIARYPDDEGEIKGLLTLTIYRVPTGLRSIVEDVVVDETVRRLGIGEALIHYALELAREAGVTGVALTSNPQRVAANQLYQSMGFKLRQTNSYFYQLK